MNLQYLYLFLSLTINSFNMYILVLYSNELTYQDYMLIAPMLVFSVLNLNLMSFLIRCLCSGENARQYLLTQILCNLIYVMLTTGIFFSLNRQNSPILNCFLINISGQLIHSVLCFIIYFIKVDNNSESSSDQVISNNNTVNPILLFQLKSHTLKGFEELETKYRINQNEIYLNLENKTNPLTLEDFEINQEITVLKCHHFFEKEGLKQWLKSNLSCPLCREIIH